MPTYDTPDVYGREIDLSQIVRSAATSIGAIVGAAERGRTNERLLLTTTKDTTNILGKPRISDGYAVFSLLAAQEEMNQCYFTRVVGTGAAFSGVIVNKADSASPTSSFSSSVTITDPSTQDPIIDLTDEELSVTGDTTEGPYNDTLAHYPVTAIDDIKVADVSLTNLSVDLGDGTISADELSSGTIDADTGAISLTFSVGNEPENGDTFKVTYTGTSTDAVFMVFADNEGAWGNTLKIEVTDVDATENEFTLTAYETVDGVDIKRTSQLVSRQVKKDGYGRQMFVEDHFNDNNIYIRVTDFSDVNAETVDPEPTVSSVSLAGGVDGNAVSASDVQSGWELYRNPDDVDVNILINGGFVGSTDFAVQSTMKSIAEERRDCFAILDAPYDELSMSPTTDLSDWRRDTQNFNSSFTALYSPWIEVYNRFTDQRNVPMPPSGFVAAVYARTHYVADAWYPPAGLNRGLVDSGVIPFTKLTHNYTSGQQGILYSNGVNYLRTFPGEGTAVFGQKTQQAKASALDRVNVRFLILVTEKAAKAFLKYKLFELNNEFTRADITEALTRYFAQVQARNGVYAFKVVCSEMNNPPQVIDENQLNVDVYMQPQRSAEWIQYQSVITRTGTDFNSIIGSTP